MAEEKPSISKPVDDVSVMSRDDMRALEYVLQHVRVEPKFDAAADDGFGRIC